MNDLACSWLALFSIVLEDCVPLTQTHSSVDSVAGESFPTVFSNPFY